MNRNAILAASIALVVGLWTGMVLARPAGGGGGPGFAAGSLAGGALRAADAPRAALFGADEMAFVRLRIDTAEEAPKACLEFSQPVNDAADASLRDYLALEPAAPFNVEANGALVCLTGLAFEPERELTIRAGLPAASGARTAADERVTIAFGDRPPFVGFAGSGVILPRTEADGLAIETVNVSKLAIEVLRVGDRAFNRVTVDEGAAIAEGSYSWWEFDNAGDNLGSPVYKGEIDIADKDPQSGLSRQNTPVTTVFALGAALKEFKPGAYVVKVKDASPGAGARSEYEDRAAAAHRWILYTDLALQSFQGASGVDVVARSLETAKPVSGVRLALVADNNEILAEARTDASGRGRFAAPVLAGEGALRPRHVLAYGPQGDFTALDFERPTLDLSDRDVAGRSAPGDIDAYLYTDRGIYRPGETVRLTALVRDAAAKAVTNRQSVLVVYRPNGTEARRTRLERAAEAGAIIKNIPIDAAAPRGSWRAELLVDGQQAPAGAIDFAVEDFVPQRLKVEATLEERPMTAGEERAAEISARFLYGAPGAGLTVQGEARLARDPNPFPEHPGFSFGRVDESYDERFLELPSTVTDGDGRARLLVSLADAPSSSLPLSARVTATVLEPGGRAVSEGFRIPVRMTARYLGLKAKFEGGGVAEGAPAAFDLIAVDPAGKRIAARGLKWTLVEEDWNYDWYLDGGEWRWRRTGRDIPVAAGSVDVAADASAAITREKLRPASYRLIVTDGAGAETSTRFYAGWSWDAGDRQAPDVVAVAAPVEPVKPGSRAKVRIKAPYPGEAQIVIATDRVLEMRTLRVGPDGADVDLRIDPAWGAGVYVLATVMTPRDAVKLPVPRRAVGAAYVPIDMGARTIAVELPQNQVLRPRTRVEVPVALTGAPRGERVRLTLAAVDEGILQITKFESPDPTRHFFGKRALGVDIRDDYGRILNPNLGAPAIARQGGDGLGGEGLTTVPTKTVALWSGLISVDRAGKATIPLDLPDFNGELRLMAVAWSETGLGADAEPATVRDPVVAELTLPRFLAPGDEASATLELSNVEGPAGAYRVNVTGSGAARMAGFGQSFTLAKGGQTRALIPLQGAGASGLGRVNLTLEGPGGLKLSRGYDIQSRPQSLPITETAIASQAPGETFRLTAEAFRPFAPGEGEALVSYSALRGIDSVPLLDALERYPYGCTEQLTSTTLPLLYANALAQAARGKSDPALRARVQESVNRLLDRQGSDGAFGLWRAEDRAASPWLGAYVVDFLQRAKKAGYVVPEKPMRDALTGLKSVAKLTDFAPVGYDFEVYVWQGSNDSRELMRSRASAYALYVLAKGGAADIGQLRYFHDTRLAAEPSPLARAHIAAGLWHLGDRGRAQRAFKAAEDALGYKNTGDYYQTTLRDVAGVLALAAEAQQTALVDRLAKRLERETREPEAMTTQEQAHVLVAADALIARAGAVSLTANGAPLVGPAATNAALIGQGLVLVNAGKGPVFRTLTLSGRTLEPPPAAAQGFTLQKRLFTVTGAPKDPGSLRQGERVIVALSGQTQDNRLHPAVLVDLLPGGLEIESVLGPADGLGEGPYAESGAFAWLGALTPTRVAEARDDRFVAAADLAGQSFQIAYMARAVTPGRYVLPGALIEDMYRPGVFGRTAPGRITVAP